MASCSLGLTMMVALLTVQAATPTWAEDIVVRGHGSGRGAAQTVRHIGPYTPPPADRGRGIATGWLASDVPQAAQAPRLPQQPWSGVTPAGGPNSEAWVRPVRLPPTRPPNVSGLPSIAVGPTPGLPVDGTWREHDGCILINLHGQEMRLVKESPEGDRGNHSSQSVEGGGNAYGRLMHRGRPLANCQVIIVPLAKGITGYRLSPSSQPSKTVTDQRGLYSFQNVPAGAYKLSWLPAGQNRWIRRLVMQPDVFIRANKTTQVKDIRVALRTLN